MEGFQRLSTCFSHQSREPGFIQLPAGSHFTFTSDISLCAYAVSMGPFAPLSPKLFPTHISFRQDFLLPCSHPAGLCSPPVPPIPTPQNPMSCTLDLSSASDVSWMSHGSGWFSHVVGIRACPARWPSASLPSPSWQRLCAKVTHPLNFRREPEDLGLEIPWRFTGP